MDQKLKQSVDLVKPYLRGHFHQAAFFIALGASLMLIAKAQGQTAIVVVVIYCLSLMTLLGVSALYHRITWNPGQRAWMRRLDHSAIFLLIAGTCTPMAILGIRGDQGLQFLAIIWATAVVGMIQSLFWVNAPKWLAAILYLIAGWLAVPYLPEINRAMGSSGVFFLLSGGIVYSLGALVYAFKRPNPFPKTFGYHEIFHILVVIAAALHFIAIDLLLSLQIS